MGETTRITSGHWRSADLELLPDDGVRYEIIDGELYMARSPHWLHQKTCGVLFAELHSWSQRSGQGQASVNPGVLFSEADTVIPDVVWSSHERLAALMDSAGHLTGAPELIAEVLSEGTQHVRRDREAKRKLYEAFGVQEYWIVDWRAQQVEVYRREQAALKRIATLYAADELTSPLLPGFACLVARLFA